MLHGGGAAQKMDDFWTIPLCRSCHNRWHASNTYRRLGDLTVLESDALLANTQLMLMSRWILLLDVSSELF